MSSLFFKTKISEGKKWIFDPIRKKHIVCTPEEEVRQFILAYLVETKNYPISLISVEKQVIYAEKSRRYDVVVYNRNLQAVVLIECKQPKVKITQKTMEQATLYNQVLQVPYLILTNGEQHYIVHLNLKTGQYSWLTDVPEWEEIDVGM